MTIDTIPVQSMESIEEVESQPGGDVRRWLIEIQLAEKEQEVWRTRGKRIVQRYRDERQDINSQAVGINDTTKYNILWSNVNTLKPSLFSRTPKPQVERRYKDGDPIGRTAATILERATDYAVKTYDFDEVMENCVLDLLLCGRGQAWVRYVPYFNTEFETVPVRFDEESEEFFDPAGNIIDEADVQEEPNGKLFTNVGEAEEQVIYEEVRCDYVYWEDFIHSPARTWDKVTWVGRRLILTKDEVRERFGPEVSEMVPLDHTVARAQGQDNESLGPEYESFKKAIIYEIWDKDSRKVYWLSKGVTERFLDEEDDPLGLTEFFPCPKPLLATTTTDSLIPVADFSMYQDQARELDELSTRITLLVRALKAVGVYDASFDGVKRILSEGVENKLIPLPDWPSFQVRGGFQGVMQFMPLAEVASTLSVLYDSRAVVLQDIFQITGISDIIRGATSPSETATAQQIKGQFATLRLAERQQDVQRYAKDLVALKAEVIAEHFYSETIRLMTGVDFIEHSNVVGTFDKAVELLRNDVLRAFRVSVETDSTLAIDEALEKEKRTEFLGTIGRFLSNTTQAIQITPELAPMLKQSLMFLMRGFKASRSLEAATEQSLDALIERVQKQAAEPQGPSPEQLQAQAEMQIKQQAEAAKLQIEQFKAQSKIQLEQQKAFADAEIKQLRLQIEAKESQFNELLDVQKAQADIQLQREKLELETQLKAAEIQLQTALKREQLVARENVETIEALTNGKDNGAEIPPMVFNIDAKGSGVKRATFRDGPNNTRVAEVVEVNE